jgi:hypothetical protein
LPIALRKKFLHFSKLINILPEESTLKAIKFIIQYVGASMSNGHCRLSCSSASFMLLCLDACVSASNIELIVEIVECYTRLLSCIDYKLASQLKLTSQCPIPDKAIKWNNFDSLRLLHFFPRVSADWSAFGKFLSEIKGSNEQVIELISFLTNFLALNVSNTELVSIVDRMSRRNGPLASILFLQICESETFPDCIEAYLSVFEALIPLDNESVQFNVSKIAGIVPLSSSLTSSLMSKLPSSSPKGKEFISKFLAITFSTNLNELPAGSPNFVDLAGKELSNEGCLRALIHCAGLCSNDMESFLVANLKGTQKLSVRSAIILGLCSSRKMDYFSSSVLKELFAPSILKDSLLAGTDQARNFYICALAAHVYSSSSFEIDSPVFQELLQNLTKPVGAAVLCEKGWAQFDLCASRLFIELVVVPVVFDGQSPLLQGHCIAALTWMIVNGSKDVFIFLKKRLQKIDCRIAELFAACLSRYLDGNSVSEDKAHRVWRTLSLLCSPDALKSRSLALVCHDKSKLLGAGSGSWAELVRLNFPEPGEFCRNQIDQLVDFKSLLGGCSGNGFLIMSPSFYLLETMVSLCPELVSERQLVSGLESSVEGLLKYSPAHWSLLAPSAAKSVPVKALSGSGGKSNPTSPSVDDAAMRQELLASVQECKRNIAMCRAVALAIPFHSCFRGLRSGLVVSLLRLVPCVEDVELRAFVIGSVYEIASESLDGQGALLVSLYLHRLGFDEHVNASWRISDSMTLVDSVFRIIIGNSDGSDALLVAFTVGTVLGWESVAKPALFESHEFSALVVKMRSILKEIAYSGELLSTVMLGLVQSLLGICPTCSRNVRASVLLLLVDIGEMDDLRIESSFLSGLNVLLRESNASCRLIILKFLVALYGTYGEGIPRSSDLDCTIQLLHFKTRSITSDHESNSSDEPSITDNNDHEEDEGYDFDEIGTVAQDLCSLLCIEISGNFDALLAEICLLETEGGSQIKNLQEHYIAALGSSIRESSCLPRIASAFERLLETRAVPNGLVRLTKDLDRSKFDFTKQTRRALLLSIDYASRNDAKNDKIAPAQFIQFIFEFGFRDVDESNCEIGFSTALHIVESVCGNGDSVALYEQLQGFLEKVPQENDRVRVFAVILVGRASVHRTDPDSVWALIDKIRENLTIPSEHVQRAVSDTLVPLLRLQSTNTARIGVLATTFISQLGIGQATGTTHDYGTQRGAAFGIAALIEAVGTGIVHSHGLFELLHDALARLPEKGSDGVVCGALAAIEIIAIRCGCAFEPYTAPLLPGILKALGDSRARVREDAQATASALATSISPLSCALILPPLLEIAGLPSSSPRYTWRGKLGAVTWLGAMAGQAASRSLTLALPKIIPALIVALQDTNERVHLAAHDALAVKYAAIIRSPEIKAALPAILRALSDPPRYAAACLGDIIGTSFCHAVDGPSLALLEPLLSRALMERGTGAMSEAKRRSILIIANLGSLMDPAELRPHLQNIVPALCNVLGDPVPQIRSAAARALGILAKLMNSNGLLLSQCPVLVKIVPDCLQLIFSSASQSNASAIDRAGAAQAIAQVTASQGLEALISLVQNHVSPVIFQTSPDSLKNSPAKEALLHLCAALPDAVPRSQMPQLYTRIFTQNNINAILKGVADEDEGVREISAKTIRSILLRQALFINLQGALETILRGTTDGRWRIRLASFTLLADILPCLSSQSADDIKSSSSTDCNTQSRILSLDMRSRVLSRLFFGRFDSNSLIRNTSFSLWKSIVTHPPRVILEILPILVDDCVASLELINDDEDSEEEDESEYEDESNDENDSSGVGSDDDDDSSSSTSEQQQHSNHHKLDRYEMATAALKDILVKLADRIMLPFLRRLISIVAIEKDHDNEAKFPGILLAAQIITSILIIPNLTPPHLRSSPLVVSVPRPQVDEALALVLQLTKRGLVAQTENAVRVAVSLFAKIARGTRSSPNLHERIITDLFYSSDSQDTSEALISVLNRQPKTLLDSLISRFKASDAAIDWDWWKRAFEAPGPFLAPHAPVILSHTLKLLNYTDLEPHLDLLDIVLASMSAYDPDIYYGDDDVLDDDSDEDSDSDNEVELENAVESGLFSFGQILETLWSARNLPHVTAKLIERFALGGSFGIERFYDTWLDRLLVACITTQNSDQETCAKALENIIQRAVERGEPTALITNFNQTIETRSTVSALISSQIPQDLLVVLLKGLCLPVITDVNATDRYEAARLLHSICVSSSGGNIKSLSTPNSTALLGALIRALSDRSDTTSRLKATLLQIVLHFLHVIPTAAKPFHPQLVRLGVNVLKDLIAAVSIGGNSIDFDQDHARGQIAHVSCQIVSLLLTQMNRVDLLIEELGNFRVIDDSEIYDDLSTRNARRILIAIVKTLTTLPPPSASSVLPFCSEIIRQFMVLPSKEIDLIRETASIGLVMAEKTNDSELKDYINKLI